MLTYMVWVWVADSQSWQIAYNHPLHERALHARDILREDGFCTAMLHIPTVYDWEAGQQYSAVAGDLFNA